MTDGFVMELCGNRAAWQIVPENIDSIDLESVGNTIEKAVNLDINLIHLQILLFGFLLFSKLDISVTINS